MTKPSSKFQWISNSFSQRSVQVAIGGYFLAIVIANILGAEGLPFNRPLMQDFPLLVSLLIQPAIVWPIYLLLFLGVIYFITRRREVPDMASRAPEKELALREALGLLVYGETDTRSHSCH